MLWNLRIPEMIISGQVRYPIPNLIHTELIWLPQKSCVAPLHKIIIPSLEVCSALLLSNLPHFISTTFKSAIISRIVAWYDSTVAVSWIKSTPHQWITFVSNRIIMNWTHFNSIQLTQLLEGFFVPILFETRHGDRLLYPKTNWPYSSVDISNLIIYDDWRKIVCLAIRDRNPIWNIFI